MSGLAATNADAKRIEAPDAENVALQIAALLAVDPAGLAGVLLRGPHHLHLGQIYPNQNGW